MTAPDGAAPEPTILIILDGWTRRVFEQLLLSRRLPEISDWIAAGAKVIPDVVSIVPSISLSSHATLLTGQPPSVHGIPGHRWLDGDSRRVRDYIGLGARHVNHDLNVTVSTAFECHGASSFATQSVVSRGAIRTRRLPTQSPGRLLASAVKTFRDTPKGLHVIWLPGGDAVSHRHGPDSLDFASELEMTSRYLGIFLEDVRRIRPETRVLAVPDHGQRTVSHSSRIKDIASWAPHTLRGTPTVVNPQFRLQRQPDELVVLTGGDSSVSIYPPQTFEESKVADLAVELRASEHFEQLVHSSHSTHLLYGMKGIARFEEASDGSVEYLVTEGEDPLEPGSSLLHRKFCPESVDATGPYPDFVPQYLSSRVPGRSAPLIGFAREGAHFGWGPRPGWRLGNHRGSHGGGTADEVLVSALLDAPGTSIAEGAVRSHELLSILEFGTLPARRRATSSS
ncbi:MAG: alkaline phosphatase family protein [Dermatophilaceae bacterium]